MKKLLLIAWIGASSMYACAQGEKTIGELERVSSIVATDAIPVEQADETRKMYFSDLIGGVLDSVVITSFDGTANRFFVTDASGNVTEIGFGTDGQVLTSNGAILAPSFEDATGDVSGVAGSGLTYANDSINIGGFLSDNATIDIDEHTLEFINTELGQFITRSIRTTPNEKYSVIQSSSGTVSLLSYNNTTSTGPYSHIIINAPIVRIGAVDRSNSMSVLDIDTTGLMNITDQINSKGFVYNDDYSVNGLADNRWLPDIAAVRSEISDSIRTAITDTVDISDVAWMLADTIILGSFSKDTTRVGDLYGSFYNGTDQLVITEVICVLQGSSPSVTVDLQWHSDFNSSSSTHLNTTPPTVTSTTSGDVFTSFDNDTISPDSWVWLETPTVTTPGTYISVSLMGYRVKL